jgi:hypothetical protein
VRVRIARIADAVPLAAVLEVPRAQADKGQVSFDELKVDVAVPFVDLGAGPYAVDLERTPDRLWIVPRAFPKLRVGIDPKATRGFVEVPSITPEEIERIASVSVPGQRISAKGEGSLTGKDARSGTFDVTIAGFVPPHPRELSGIVFGDETRVTGKFRIDGLAIALDDLAVRAGSFVLKGTGRISLGGGVTLELKGSVGCTELAASAVGSHLGLGAAVLTRRIASGRLGGSVEVRVTVEGDVSSVEDLKVVPSAFVRCKVVI